MLAFSAYVFCSAALILPVCSDANLDEMKKRLTQLELAEGTLTLIEQLLADKAEPKDNGIPRSALHVPTSNKKPPKVFLKNKEKGIPRSALHVPTSNKKPPKVFLKNKEKGLKCKDFYTFCERAKPLCYTGLVRKLCRKSCELCNKRENDDFDFKESNFVSSNEKTCKDVYKTSICKYYASFNGYCEEEKGTMIKYCRKTCNYCDNTSKLPEFKEGGTYPKLPAQVTLKLMWKAGEWGQCDGTHQWRSVCCIHFDKMVELPMKPGLCKQVFKGSIPSVRNCTSYT